MLDISQEGGSVHRPIQQHRGCHARQSQPGREGRRSPMSVQGRRAAAFALDRPTTKPCHLGIRAGLVDKDQPIGIEFGLAIEPVLAPAVDVRAFLLSRVARLFLCVRPRLVKKYQTVAGQARTLRTARSRLAISCIGISLSVDTRARMKASCASSFEPSG